jgi:hypothetical protein
MTEEPPRAPVEAGPPPLGNAVARALHHAQAIAALVAKRS